MRVERNFDALNAVQENFRQAYSNNKVVEGNVAVRNSSGTNPQRDSFESNSSGINSLEDAQAIVQSGGGKKLGGLVKVTMTPEQRAAYEEKMKNTPIIHNIVPDYFFNRMKEEDFDSLRARAAMSNRQLIVKIDDVEMTLDDAVEVWKSAVVQDAKNVRRNDAFKLDYDDYAKMGITEGVIKQYGQDSLSEERASVFNNLIEKYNNIKIEKEQKWLENNNVVHDMTPAFAKYYNRFISSDDWKKSCENSIKQWEKEREKETSPNMKEAYTNFIRNTQAELDRGNHWANNSASNTELADSIRQLFAKADYTSENAIQSTLDKYVELLKPTLSWDVTGKTLDSILSSKREEANSLINSLFRVAQNSPMDLKV